VRHANTGSAPISWAHSRRAATMRLSDASARTTTGVTRDLISRPREIAACLVCGPPGSHRDADVGRCQRRRIDHAVADHHCDAACTLLPHRLHLVCRRLVGQDRIRADRRCHQRPHVRVVAGNDHDTVHARAAQLPDRAWSRSVPPAGPPRPARIPAPQPSAGARRAELGPAAPTARGGRGRPRTPPGPGIQTASKPRPHPPVAARGRGRRTWPTARSGRRRVHGASDRGRPRRRGESGPEQ
jgi:hypothetical protein